MSSKYKKTSKKKIFEEPIFGFKINLNLLRVLNVFEDHELKIKIIKSFYGLNLNRLIDIEKLKLNGQKIPCIIVYKENIENDNKVYLQTVKAEEVINYDIINPDANKLIELEEELV